MSSSDNGLLYRRYVPGPGVDETLVWYDSADTSQRRWLLTDEQGSVTAVTDAGANALAINTYDEYGQPGGANIGRIQYTGQKWVPEIGLYDYKARDYSPTLGRFMQTDPIGYKDELNLYGYVKDDPTNKVDPTGEDWWSDFWAAVKDIAHSAGLYETEADRVRDARNFLENNSIVENGKVVDELKLTDKQALEVFNKFNQEWQQEEEAGRNPLITLAAAAPLKFIHSDEAMRGNLSGTQYWSKKSTEEIIDSLQPGKQESLKVKADGTVVNGQTRLQILQQRGVDINSLPREPYP